MTPPWLRIRKMFRLNGLFVNFKIETIEKQVVPFLIGINIGSNFLANTIKIDRS
jgi:hypothetical protein